MVPLMAMPMSAVFDDTLSSTTPRLSAVPLMLTARELPELIVPFPTMKLPVTLVISMPAEVVDEISLKE